MDRRPARFATWLAPTVVALGAAILPSCGDGESAPPAGGGKEAPAVPVPAPAPLPEGAPKLTFTDHAPALGLAPQFRGRRTHQTGEDMAGGVAVADFDGDGRPDILVVGAGALPEGGQTRLYRNETELRGGTLVLKDVTKDAGLPGLLPTMGVAVADTDGDGDLDVLLTLVGGVRLLRNDGGMTFTDVTRASGLLNAEGCWCTGAAFGDADGDGDLDLYVCRYVEQKKGRALNTIVLPSFSSSSNLFFRNDGSGHFVGSVVVAEQLGIGCEGGSSLTALFGDFDRDGIDDLCVACESEGVAYFRNSTPDGGRHGYDARQMLAAPGVAALAAADVEGDGDDDLLVACRSAGQLGLLRNVAANSELTDLRLPFDAPGPAGTGTHTVSDLIETSGVSAWAIDFADFDLDGRPDLFAAGGDATSAAGQRALVFWNAGKDPTDPTKDRGFVDAGGAWGPGWNSPRSLRGGASADLDGDGDPDVVFGALDGPPAVLLNEGDRRGRPLTVALRAPAPNTFGVGARVTVKCDGRVQSREMRSSPGYLSAGPLVLLFGLGDAKGPATVSVRWPDGTTSENVVDATERWPVITKSSKR